MNCFVILRESECRVDLIVINGLVLRVVYLSYISFSDHLVVSLLDYHLRLLILDRYSMDPLDMTDSNVTWND